MGGGGMNVSIWQGANLALAFILEVAALAALAYWGVATGDSTAAKIALGIGAPLVAAILWGLFAAPRALIRQSVLRLAVKVIVFGAAVLGLFATGHDLIAIVFAVVVIANTALLYAGEQGHAEPLP